METATKPATTEDAAVAFRDLMMENLVREIQCTKTVLAAVPQDQAGFRPDPKARTAAELAWHIAAVDVQMAEEIVDGEFKMEPRYEQAPATIAEIADWYERNFNRALDRIRGMSPTQLTNVIDFFGAFKLPAFLYLMFLNNHSIHHRGQLSTYLRPMGSKVPSIYGPSADVDWKP